MICRLSVQTFALATDDADLLPAEAALEVLYAASIPDMVFPRGFQRLDWSGHSSSA